VGVHLTPSAEYVFKEEIKPSAWIPFTPPTKTKINWRPHCVHWTRDWRKRELEIESVKNKFRQLGPIVPEYAVKFANTLDFIERTSP
jgi:hypothetical protein